MYLTATEQTLADSLRSCAAHDTEQGMCAACGLHQHQERYILRVLRALGWQHFRE